MIEVITDGMNANVIAFSAHGKVTHDDYVQVLIPTVNDMIAKHGKVRLFYHLGKDVTGYEIEAIWDDARSGIRHFSAFEKIAVITDIVWLKDAVKIFAVIKPCPVKTFPNAEIVTANDWINAPIDRAA